MKSIALGPESSRFISDVDNIGGYVIFERPSVFRSHWASKRCKEKCSFDSIFLTIPDPFFVINLFLPLQWLLGSLLIRGGSEADGVTDLFTSHSTTLSGMTSFSSFKILSKEAKSRLRSTVCRFRIAHDAVSRISISIDVYINDISRIKRNGKEMIKADANLYYNSRWIYNHLFLWWRKNERFYPLLSRNILTISQHLYLRHLVIGWWIFELKTCMWRQNSLNKPNFDKKS